MRKGVIVQLDKNAAYILKTDGSFVTCLNQSSWQVGDVVTLPRRSAPKTLLAACFIIITLFAGTGAYLYTAPAVYLEISVNPAVQLSVNRFSRVLHVTGLNTDGDTLIANTSYRNLTAYEACSRIFNRLENDGYMNDAAIQLVLAGNSQKKVDQIEQILRSALEKHISDGSFPISIKRYTADEYQALPHPLPMVVIPDETPQAEAPPSGNMPHNNCHGRWHNGWWDWDKE